jgi:hypothetical protein
MPAIDSDVASGCFDRARNASSRWLDVGCSHLGMRMTATSPDKAVTARSLAAHDRSTPLLDRFSVYLAAKVRRDPEGFVPVTDRGKRQDEPLSAVGCR